MTDFLPVPGSAVSLPLDLADVVGLSDEATEALWNVIYEHGAVVLRQEEQLRLTVGLLLYRELRLRGEAGVRGRVADLTQALGVNAATLARWRREAEERFELQPPSARVTAHRATTARGAEVASPGPAVSRAQHPSHPSYGSDAFIDVRGAEEGTEHYRIGGEAEEDGTERQPVRGKVNTPLHSAKGVAAVIHVEPDADELAVIDAWSALLQLDGSDVFLRMLRRVKPPTVDQGGISREHAVLRRAWKKLTGQDV